MRSIPPAPRRVRLRSLVGHRWPLLAIGSTLLVLGMLIAWLMFLQSGGKLSQGPLLDEGPAADVVGKITFVSEPLVWDGKQEVRYDFHWNGVRLSGISFVAGGSCAVGDEVTIEVSTTDPNVSRVKGGVLYPDRAWLQARFWIGTMVVPGVVILLGWLAGFFQLRQVLVHGDVSVGRVTAIANVRFVLPEMLRVTYEFRDHRAVTRVNSHWVRVHGPLGSRLVRQMHTGWLEPMPVLHDRRLPQWNRMLLPGDFLPQASHHALPANGIT
ncbi:MAG TPA: hypothetical protein VF384_12830 [Planctomycetota bacterium]